MGWWQEAIEAAKEMTRQFEQVQKWYLHIRECMRYFFISSHIFFIGTSGFCWHECILNFGGF